MIVGPCRKVSSRPELKYNSGELLYLLLRRRFCKGSSATALKCGREGR